MNKAVFFIFLLLSLIEGGVLMAFEILSTKIYTPYLGSSIYVWTSVLTVTLVGLALGYRVGGKWSLEKIKGRLIMAYGLAGLLIIASTFIADLILPSLIDLNVRLASIVAGFIVLFFPVFFMGTVSPLIIGELNRNKKQLSTATGIIFGTGTVGGIILLLATVFLFIPELGVQMSSIILGALMILGAGIVSLLKFQDHD